jgi:hypothetical protein
VHRYLVNACITYSNKVERAHFRVHATGLTRPCGLSYRRFPTVCHFISHISPGRNLPSCAWNSTTPQKFERRRSNPAKCGVSRAASLEPDAFHNQVSRYQGKLHLRKIILKKGDFSVTVFGVNMLKGLNFC